MTSVSLKLPRRLINKGSMCLLRHIFTASHLKCNVQLRYTMPSSMCFAYLVCGPDVVWVFPPSLKSLIKCVSITGHRGVIFPGATLISTGYSLGRQPCYPWASANNRVKYSAVLTMAPQGYRSAQTTLYLEVPIRMICGEMQTTVPGSHFPHPVHLSCPSFGELYLNHIWYFHPLTFVVVSQPVLWGQNLQI